MQTEKQPLFRDPEAALDARVDDLLGRLEPAEKTAQLRHDAPAVKRLGIPAYNWWNEALHGVARNGRATVFPQAIGLAASWNRALAHEVADAISTEARAKHHYAARRDSHQQYQGLTFWTPNINIFRDPRWGRGQETWGEDPHLTAEMALSFVRGLQGDDPNWLKTAACAKHFAVHSGPEADRHHFDACPPEKDFRETYLPAFERLVRAGVEAVMPAYNRTYGEPCAGSNRLLGDILRGEWDFQGHVVSDCWAIVDFHAHHKVTTNAEESAAMALKAGTDLNCGSVYCAALDDALALGLIEEADVDRALRRLLRTRFKLGLFDPADSSPHARIPITNVNCEAHRELALRAATDSLVLLKNKGSTLPFDDSLRSLLVIGPNAASIEPMLGNYFGLSAHVSTVVEGLMGRMPEGVKADYRLGTGLYEASRNDLDWAIGEAAGCDCVVAAMGLSPVLEGEEGDAILSPAKGDRDRIELPDCQVDLLRKIRDRIDRDSSGTRIIVLLFGGAAMAVPEIHEMADAVLQVWYPGERGGEAIASVLWGDAVPGGHLPVTVPRSTEVLPPYEDYGMAGRSYRFMKEADVLYPFGFGLGYTRVFYSDLQAPATHDPRQPLPLGLTLTNTGEREAREVAQVYLRPADSSSVKLAAFESLTIAPGEQRELRLFLDPRDLLTTEEDGQRHPLCGRFELIAAAAAPSIAARNLGAPAPITAIIDFCSEPE